MFVLRGGEQPPESTLYIRCAVRDFLRLSAVIFLAPLIAVSGAGCAQKQTPTATLMKPHRLTHETGRQVSNAYAKVDLEKDGFEAQQPPLLRTKVLVDDPSEPFSPNYGRSASWDLNQDGT